MEGNLNKAAKVLEDIIKLSIDIERDIRCKFCNSRDIVKNGHRKGTQYWLCKNCGHGFVANKSVPKSRYPTLIHHQKSGDRLLGAWHRRGLKWGQDENLSPKR